MLPSFLLLPLAATLAQAYSSIDDVSFLAEEPQLDPRVPQCRPLDFAVQVTVPYLGNLSANPFVTVGGHQFRLPRAATQGALVSFYGNFQDNGTNTGINTTTNSTEQPNGPSFSNSTSSVNETSITTITFSSGNSSSAAAGAQGSTQDSSTSSTGAANSTAVATADASGNVMINTNATVAAASDAQSLQNEMQAAAATSCAANNDGAQSSATLITTVTFTTKNGAHVTSQASAACSAGDVIPTDGQDDGSSSSGSQASVSGVTASVMCNGVTTTNTESSTTYILKVGSIFAPLHRAGSLIFCRSGVLSVATASLEDGLEAPSLDSVYVNIFCCCVFIGHDQ